MQTKLTVAFPAIDIKIATIMKAKEICKERDLSRPLYVCILKGGTNFFTDLTRYLPVGTMQYCRAEKNGAGEVELTDMMPPPADARNKKIKYSDVLIIDDICYTGETLKRVYEYYKTECEITMGCGIYTATLINAEIGDLSGFNKKAYNPTYFIYKGERGVKYAGYGADNTERDRNLEYIYKIPQEMM